MGLRRGEKAREALPPPPGRPRPAKNSVFLDLFGKNSIFLLFFRQKVGYCPPRNFCPPLEKSLRTPMFVLWGFLVCSSQILNVQIKIYI